MNCYNCGKQIPEESAFCSFCGKEQDIDSIMADIANDKHADRRYNKKNRVRKYYWIIYSVFIILIIAIAAYLIKSIILGQKNMGNWPSDQNEPTTYNQNILEYLEQVQQADEQKEFNVSDKFITTNGNLQLAARKIVKYDPSLVWQSSKEVSPEEITKSPYSCIGKLYKLTGSVYKVEELPPTLNLGGQWTEVFMLVENTNSALGTTSVSFEYYGDPNDIDPNTTVMCAGYFIGIYEGENALGGIIEGIVIVGNSFRKIE